MKTKTIKRKPSWPPEARHFAIDKDGHAFLYEQHPFVCHGGLSWSAPGGFCYWFRARKPYRTDAWKLSLRMIVP